MRKLSARQGILLFYLIDAVLLLVLVISFAPLSRKNSVRSEQTALLNPNRAGDVSSITISVPDESVATGRTTVTLQRHGTLWSGTSSLSADSYRWPADAQSVANLFTAAQKITTVYTKADDVSAWKPLGIEDADAAVLSFWDERHSIVSQLFFGGSDALTRRIFFRTWTKTTAYEIDDSISSYLSADESFWADPFVYPQALPGADRAASESFLRRGLLLNIAPREGLPETNVLARDFGNGALARFRIYEKDGSYVVIPSFSAGPASGSAERSMLESLNYRYSISAWTYERWLSEETVSKVNDY